jgi:hypothetical protein
MPSAFPMLTCTLNLTLSAAVVIDLNTVWLQHWGATAGTLQSAVADGDTTLTLQRVPDLAVGAAILVDNEPMTVSGVAGSTLTVARYATAFPFLAALPTPPTSAHAAGASVYVLNFATPWEMIANLALRPWTQQMVNGLGAASATFGTFVSGSLSAA